MASFHHVIRYYSRYRLAALFSIAASSLFQLVDLAVPYCIGQILNVLSNQPIDSLSQNLVNWVSTGLGQPTTPALTCPSFWPLSFWPP